MIGGYTEIMPFQLEAYAASLTSTSVQYREEPFQLKAGGESNWYIDLREGLSSYDMWSGLGVLALTKVQLVNIAVDVVAAEGIGAAPVQAAILGEARQQRTPFRRAEAVLKSTPGEQYGVGVHGAKVTDCQVLAVDDTISTASSLIESIEMLRANNATVEHALGVVDRSQGKATQALANIGVVFHSLFQFDESTGQITPMV